MAHVTVSMKLHTFVNEQTFVLSFGNFCHAWSHGDACGLPQLY